MSLLSKRNINLVSSTCNACSLFKILTYIFDGKVSIVLQVILDYYTWLLKIVLFDVLQFDFILNELGEVLCFSIVIEDWLIHLCTVLFIYFSVDIRAHASRKRYLNVLYGLICAVLSILFIAISIGMQGCGGFFRYAPVVVGFFVMFMYSIIMSAITAVNYTFENISIRQSLYWHLLSSSVPSVLLFATSICICSYWIVFPNFIQNNVAIFTLFLVSMTFYWGARYVLFIIFDKVCPPLLNSVKTYRGGGKLFFVTMIQVFAILAMIGFFNAGSGL